MQGTVDCDRQIFSLADCPRSSSVEERTNDDGNNVGNIVGNNDGNNVGNGLNIEPQIPSVIPFP